MMSVNSLNIKIKSLLEISFMHIKVEGEISSVTYHQASGHVYFSIKDDKSSIKCVMFRSNAQKLRFILQKGEHIVVDGSLGVYTPRGEYQFYAVHVEPFGRGALALAYAQLKDKLKKKGYFEVSNKKIIPKNIQKLALVTAKNSAALHDMIKIIEKRYPLVEVTVIDTLVQGNKAAREIAQALYYADSIGVDVIIVGRGGGSAEDLWVFNEEVVADAIFESYTPVVSAVGHEIDIQISDFVSDLRAPTPSAAIEMILPDKQEILYGMNELQERYKTVISQIIYHKSNLLEQNINALGRFSIKYKLEELSVIFESISRNYQRVMNYKITQLSEQIIPLKESLRQQKDINLNKKSMLYSTLLEKYIIHNPKNAIKDGWAKVSVDGKNSILKSLIVDKKFILEDANTKIEAICLYKEHI